MTLPPGTRLGAYEILSLIGAGGMGEVYEARDLRLGRTVALKVLPANLSRDAVRLARFEREARAVAALNHPNIVTLFAVERQDDRPFLVMERVEGRTLDTLLERGGLELPRILEIAAGVAEALAAAHQQGIVHRDLKPANIMVSREGRVKVLDFGLAHVDPLHGFPEGTTATSLARTAEGQVLGTIAYMAPEQLRGERVDHRSDIFSFGATLYEMAAGHPPFRGAGSADVLSAVLRDDPVPLERLRPDLPPRLSRLVTRCFAKDPAERMQSSVDLLHEIQDLRLDESRVPAILPVVLRRRGLIIAAVVAFLVLVGLTARLVAPRFRSAAPPQGSVAITSIAVLPFDNLARDRSQDYFVDGMHDALITELARLGSVRVTSRSSVMRYRGRPPESLKAAAGELGVDALVEGSVLRAGNRVRVSAQLIAARSDEHLWAQSYERDMQDVLRLLDDVSGAIAAEIGVRVGSGSSTTTGTGQVRPEAYEAWLQGRAVVHNLTSTRDYWRARDWFERAVQIDPGFARGWSSLGGARYALVFFGLAPAEETVARAREAANRALALDPRDGAALGVLGGIELYFDRDFSTARSSLEKALALDPHSFATRHAYADYLMVTGRLSESAAQTRIAYDHEPDAAIVQIVAATHAAAAREFDRALSLARSALARFPTLPGLFLHGVIGDALWAQGQEREALAEYAAAYGAESAQLLEQEIPRLGTHGALRALAARLEVILRNEPAQTITIAGLYAEAGDADAAFRIIDRAYAAGTPQILHVVALPPFDSIRRDPRYSDLLERMGIPSATR